MTRAKVPVLCIHDSFVVPYDRHRLLRGVMTYATRKVLGRDVALSHNYLGLDLVELRTPELVEDYVTFRRLERSAGYQVRKRVFEERLLYLGGAGAAGG